MQVRTLTIERAPFGAWRSSKFCKQLYALYWQAIKDIGDGGDGEDGEGAGTGAT